jgi:cell division protein FtsI (penicillin-binding protein 3)
MKPLTLATMGFGQGLFVTPLQVARAYSAILNGGFLVQPKLIKPLASEKELPPKRILTRAISEKIIDALLSVTEADEGTGHKARVDGYRIAGKTGTSQVVDPRSHRYSATHYVASFVGFAVDVEPKVVVYTQLDGPQNSIYAAETAAPLFSQVMQAVANRFALPMNPKAVLASNSDQVKLSQAAPTHKVISSTAMDGGEDAVDASTIRWEALAIDSTARKGWTMPKLSGLTAREAMRTLDGKDFKVSVKGFGTVHSQSPEAGQPVHAGDRVELRLSE